jgi:DNA-binding CsgD family transcriptional regulator
LHGKRVLLLAGTAQFALWRGDVERTTALIDECLVLAREAADEPTVALAMLCLGWSAVGLGDLDRAGAIAADGLARWRRLGESGWVGEALMLLGSIVRRRGDLAAAEALYTEALNLARTAGPEVAVAAALGGLADCAHGRGDHRRSAALLAESLALLRDHTEKDPPIVEGAFTGLAAVAVEMGKDEHAARLFGAGEAVRESYGFDPFPTERAWLERIHAVVRARLTDDVFAASRAAGRAMPLEQTITEAIAIAESILVEPTPAGRAETLTATAATYGLSPRETDVLDLLAEGRADREIAKVLFISPKTVGVHVGNILAKLGVQNRGEAIALAHRRALVPAIKERSLSSRSQDRALD